MRTVGIVVEYNPLHNGHVHHYEQSKKAAEAEACIAVMSGHFLQRGEPAVANKWARAEMALHMGADVVLELPVAYACQPAEWFAYGAVGLLDAAGVVDCLSFGSEDGRIGPLLELADRLYREPAAFRERLQAELKKGGSFPSAYAAAAAQGENGAGDGFRLDMPNNILGLHYLIALRRLGSPIVPLTVPRLIAGYHQESVTDATIASATAIRKLMLRNGGSGGDLEEIAPYVPSYTLEILRREREAGRAPMHWGRYGRLLLAQLLGRSAEELSRIQEVTEGLEHRIKRMLAEIPPEADNPAEALLGLLKTKRYTRTKLQRTLLRILLQHPKHECTPEKLMEGLSYLRVLGFSERGRELLKAMKQKAKLPVVTKVAREQSAYLDMDIRATGIYALGYRNPSQRDWLQDYYQPPVRAEGQGASLGGSFDK